MAPTLTPEPLTDQERFDAEVIRDEKVVLRVKVGVPIKLPIDNEDDVMHSITSTAGGVTSQRARAGRAFRPTGWRWAAAR